MHSALQWKKEESGEERKKESHTIKQTKFHNNLNGLEKYSLTFGEQPQYTIYMYHMPQNTTWEYPQTQLSSLGLFTLLRASQNHGIDSIT